MLGAKLLSPTYAAEMLWLPTAREGVLRIAVPELSVAVPSIVAPSLNVTVPVGTREEEPAALTVAVKLTCWPNTEGFAEALNVVVVDEAAIFATKRLPVLVFTLGSKAPGVVGKSVEEVDPVT